MEQIGMEQISVIVPIYNTAEYLDECIQSILNQSYKNLDIVLVDDGSTDGSSDKCDYYAKKDKRISVIHKENEGLVKARQDGIRCATGEYILYVDSDDWIEKDMLVAMYSTMEKTGVDVVMCGRYEDTGDSTRKVFQGFEKGRYDRKRLSEVVFPRMIVNGGFFEWGIMPCIVDKLFRRDCLEPFLMSVDERITMGEDAACVYPCLLNAESIYVLHECYYHYRQTRTSMVKKEGDAKDIGMRFRVLYQTVLDKLNEDVEIFDLRTQWKEYLLFMMVPRFHNLYQGVELLDFLFPFPRVKRDSAIIIYGMGTYGQSLYKYIEETGFCKVVATVDRNYQELRKQGLDVVSPEDIGQYEYDAIVIANSFASSRKAIFEALAKKYDKNKICVFDEELIMSEEVMISFGLRQI